MMEVSSSRYVTCNVHFEDICELDAYLKVCMTSDDVDLRKKGSGMKEKFKKYWELLGEEKGKIVNNEVDAYLKNLFAIYLVRDVLAIPMSNVALECAFSTGGRILDPFKSSLTLKYVHCLVCVQDWLRQETKSICVEESLEFLETIELGPRV
ncbi:hypothetical protein KY289_011075 [Solanum tuberosum]|nr:hypothetical protein KY289_011075 [Solanum tuberosum]